MMGFWQFHLPSAVSKYNVWQSLEEVFHWLYWVQTLALAKRWSDVVDCEGNTIGYSEYCVNRHWDDMNRHWDDKLSVFFRPEGFPIDRGHVTAWWVLTWLPTGAKALPGQGQEPQRYWCSLALHYKLERIGAFGRCQTIQKIPTLTYAILSSMLSYAILCL